MNEKQKLLQELLKLKLLYVRKLDRGTFRVETQEILEQINSLIENIEKI